MSINSTSDLVLTWQFDENDIRKAQLWMPSPEGSSEPLKLFYFSTYNRESTYYRWNLMTNRYENAGSIEWNSPRNIVLNLGMRTLPIDAMARKNKTNSRSRRFKAFNNVEHKWRPAEANPENLECVTVSGKKPTAFYNASDHTLRVNPRGHGILDDIVVLNLVHLWRRQHGIDFVIPAGASTS
ncbi:hypothetical protein FRB94_003092 [Tulasnella sp. JGI-2019a]|nr:hypothetical protein FRB94_003092 [Tulasnella sp. JGI-2019a]KAG9006183.1 hypothetical protein FRB93_008976 [Tulasnella sp. JGI-2019a]KAG9025836.1 hypothetical protein FRB95_009688 [Tulasnella sp. JGI-2019a]